MVKLAVRMAQAVLPGRVETKINEVGLVFAVKTAALADDGQVEISLRPVFGQRRGNLRWKPPPWCARRGMGTLAYLDVSHEMESSSGACLKYSTGDSSDLRYRMDLGLDATSYPVLPTILKEQPTDELGTEAHLLTGIEDFAGSRVALLGFSWAVRNARTVMKDIFNAPPPAGLGSFLGSD